MKVWLCRKCTMWQRGQCASFGENNPVTCSWPWRRINYRENTINGITEYPLLKERIVYDTELNKVKPEWIEYDIEEIPRDKLPICSF